MCNQGFFFWTDCVFLIDIHFTAIMHLLVWRKLCGMVFVNYLSTWILFNVMVISNYSNHTLSSGKVKQNYFLLSLLWPHALKKNLKNLNVPQKSYQHLRYWLLWNKVCPEVLVYKPITIPFGNTSSTTFT